MIKAGKFYQCLCTIENKGITKNRIYKSNLDGTLYNDFGNNISLYNNDHIDEINNLFLEVSAPVYFNERKQDMVHHPAHYSDGRSIEPFDVIIDWKLDYFLGCVVKYIARLGRKHDAAMSDIEKTVEDIDKAIAYLEKEKEIILKQEENVR